MSDLLESWLEAVGSLRMLEPFAHPLSCWTTPLFPRIVSCPVIPRIVLMKKRSHIQ